MPNPIFNKYNELVVKAGFEELNAKKNIRTVVSSLPFAKKIYRRIKELLNSDIIVSKERGIVSCVFMQKS